MCVLVRVCVCLCLCSPVRVDSPLTPIQAQGARLATTALPSQRSGTRPRARLVIGALPARRVDSGDRRPWAAPVACLEVLRSCYSPPSFLCNTKHPPIHTRPPASTTCCSWPPKQDDDYGAVLVGCLFGCLPTSSQHNSMTITTGATESPAADTLWQPGRGVLACLASQSRAAIPTPRQSSPMLLCPRVSIHFPPQLFPAWPSAPPR